MKIPLINCAVCNKPVSGWETWYDYADRRHHFKVSCHGDVDHCALDALDLEYGHTIVEAVAFQTKRINQQETQT